MAKENKRVLLTCFNKNLAADLRRACADEPNIDVVHLHGLMAALVDEANLEAQLPDAQTDDLMTVFYPELAQDALLHMNRLQEYDDLGCG